MKILKVFLSSLMVLICFGCQKDALKPMEYQLDGENHTLEVNHFISERYNDEEDYFASLYEVKDNELDYDTIIDTNKHLSVLGIKIGDSLDQVIKTVGLEKEYAKYDYEYDPYHDGCTEVKSGIYNGEIADFKKEHVLDYNLMIRYDLIDGKWEKHNYQTGEDVKEYVDISFDICGSKNVYQMDEGKVMSISMQYISNK